MRKPFADTRIRRGTGRPWERIATRIATQLKLLDQVTYVTPGDPSEGLYSFWDIGKRPVGGRRKRKGPKLGTRGLHSEGGGGRGLTAWDAVC